MSKQYTESITNKVWIHLEKAQQKNHGVINLKGIICLNVLWTAFRNLLNRFLRSAKNIPDWDVRRKVRHVEDISTA